jgi:hypothetical protein
VLDTIPANPTVLRTRVRRFGDTVETFNVSSDIVALNASQPTWLRFGGAKSVDYTSSGISAWSLALQSVRLFLAGQCFDNNNSSGDGCFNTQVEQFCRCDAVGSVFRRSVCQCAPSTSFTSLDSNLTAASFSSFDNETVVEALPQAVANLPTARGTWFILQKCFHGNYCDDSRIQRTLVLAVNGTWRSPAETQIAPCTVDLCDPSRSFIIDLASWGAPFPIGTQLKFAWWSNPTLAAPPGLLSQRGPVISASPTLVLTPLLPRVVPTGAAFFIAGATQNITFSSNIRRPTRIIVWMYEGLTRGFPRPQSYSDSDAQMTQLVSFCGSAPFGARISHQCVVQIPESRFPFNELYLVARVDFEGVNGTIGEIGVDVSGVYVAPLPEPIPKDPSRFQVSFTGYSIDRQVTLLLWVDSLPVDAVEVSTRRNSSYCEFRLNQNANGIFNFPSTGMLYVSISDGVRSIRFLVGQVVQCAPSPCSMHFAPSLTFHSIQPPFLF